MSNENREYEYSGVAINGFAMTLVIFILLPLIAFCSLSILDEAIGLIMLVLCIVCFVSGLNGFLIQQPNQSRVMIFFGKYKGTFRRTGFFWVNPLMTQRRVSLRIRNFDIAPIKVNDKIGNPVMIGMVLVWKIHDTYRAVFDIDSATPDNFVAIQSDAALREVTGLFAYDEDEGDSQALTLRSSAHEINELMEHKLNERLAMAGVEVVEARINYLAYAPEIAAVMLRRQQASAIISAREKIVEGAVSMVKLALERLDKDNVVELDAERKAAMVSNLLVVLCGDEPAQPVVNANLK